MAVGILAWASFSFSQETTQGVFVHINHNRSEIGCETKKQYEKYHTSTYEKDGAEPRTKGCIRLLPGTKLKRLGEKDVATIVFGNKVTIERFETDRAAIAKVWLSPSAIQERTQ